jgi:hypothetical protein
MTVIFVIVGLAAATFVPSALPRFAPGRLGAIFLLGAGANGVVLYFLGALGVPLRPLTFALVPLVALAVVLWRGRRLVRGTRWRGDIHEVASTVVILVPFVILLWTTSIVPLSDYDGRTTWIPKARAIVEEGSVRGEFFHGRRGLNLHNRYPLLMPLDAASLLALGGSVRPLFVLLPAAMLLAARDLLSRRFSTVTPSWCMAALAWLPQIVTAREGGASSAYSDLAVAAFFGMAVVTRVARGRRGAVAASVWLAFLILTKNEGVVLAAAVLAYRPRPRMFLAPAIALAFLLAWQQSIPDAYDERNAVLLRGLPSRLAQLDDAAVAIARHALDFRTWGVFWPLVAVAAFLRRRPVAALVPLVLALGAYVVVLACTSWEIAALARVTAHRLLVHGILPAACLVIACLAPTTKSRTHPYQGGA